MASTLRKKYNTKRLTTLKKRPKVGFLLTFEEYVSIVENATVCDYTGVPFTASGCDSKSIERVDDTLPYQIDNCCVVTIRANRIKDMIDKETNGTIRLEDIEIFEKIKHTLSTKTREQLVAKYQLGCVDNLKTETVNQKETKMENTVNLDINIAKEYVKFCDANKGCTITFTKFKQLTLRKTCQWSGKVFDTEGTYGKKSFAKTDLEKPFSNDNVVVVCSALKIIKENNIFSTKEMNTFTKNMQDIFIMNISGTQYYTTTGRDFGYPECCIYLFIENCGMLIETLNLMVKFLVRNVQTNLDKSWSMI